MTPPASTPSLGVVLVHGLFHGGWAWEAVREELDGAGISSVAVELPMSDLASDIAATRRTIEEFDRPAVLVGHSYGGAVITGVGDHPLVAHLVYLAAFQLAEGESVGRTLPDLEIAPTRFGEALRFVAERDEVRLDPVLAGQLLYGDAAPTAAASAIARFRPVRRAVFTGVPEVIAWRAVPSTYLVCADDLVVNPDLQRAMAARATRSLEWPVGHSPGLARPKEVADLIAGLATRPDSRMG